MKMVMEPGIAAIPAMRDALPSDTLAESGLPAVIADAAIVMADSQGATANQGAIANQGETK